MQRLALTDREAVEKRLFVLQQQGFINAYDTSWPAKGFSESLWSLIFPISDVVAWKEEKHKKKKIWFSENAEKKQLFFLSYEK
jgi:hypothetical protein